MPREQLKNVVWRLASNDTIFTIGYQKFHEDPRYEAKMSNGVWVLVIHDVQVKDMGMYECQVSSVEKHLRYYVTLIVTEPPVVQKPNIQISGTSFVNENEKIRLVCNATGVGYTPEEIDWFRRPLGSHEVLADDSGREMPEQEVLQIPSCLAGDHV
ncbi:protein amalgam-like [Physella acuta]|uniref:protein amalgam-like n=1 Tax=Physella acuta TaxID=109671 RepID=UPI0027DC47B7|nr:protein amalgam-like [Physella acuta]